MAARNLEFVLAEAQRARTERLGYLEAQDNRLGVLFALAGVLIPLAALLPWYFALVTAFFAALAAYYAVDGLRSRGTGPVLTDPSWALDRADDAPAHVSEAAVKQLVDQAGELDLRIADKSWCTDISGLFLGCSLIGAALGVVAQAVEALN
jgi:hypothetical protein